MIFNISIDSSSLNIFSSLFLYHLLGVIEGTNVLDFSNFQYLLQIVQYNFFIFLFIENILVLFYHSSHNH